MVSNPMQWIDAIKDAGGNQYTFHVEACDPETVKPLEVCQAIKKAGMKVGISIKPGTEANAVRDYIALVDLVLVMTVEPGFGGQSFMPNMMPKVLQLRTENPTLDIQVDGGPGPSTIDEAAKAGANLIVAGSSCFKKGEDTSKTIAVMRRSVEKHGQGK